METFAEALQRKLRRRAGAGYKAKNYLATEIGGRKLHFLKTDEEHVKAEGLLVEYKLKRAAFQEAEFQYLLVDEAQNARRPYGAFYFTLSLPRWKQIGWITGTPIVSGMKDLRSFLLLTWQGLKLPRFPDEVCIENVEILYHPQYDPYLEDNDLDGKSIQGIFSEKIFRELEKAGDEAAFTALGEIKYFHEMTGIPIWKLDPGFYMSAGSDKQWVVDFAKRVTKAVLNTFSARVTTSSKLVLSDGSVYYPGASMLPCVIRTEEVCFGEDLAEIVKEFGHTMASELGLAE